MMNPAMDMAEGQGLSKTMWYAATVISNNDPDELGRIQARVGVTFDGVDDADLPWAIPHNWNHPDGATENSGILIVPKKGSKVQVQFQNGHPLYPVYKGYHVDSTTKLQEGKLNYPDRAVIRFQNKALLVIDTKDNIIYARSPGDCRLCVVGNLQLEVYGNVTEKIHGNVTRQVMGNVDETINGTYTRSVKGAVKEHFSSEHHERTDGAYKVSVGGNIVQSAGGKSTYRSGGDLAMDAAMIYENSGQSDGDPGSAGDASPVQLELWPGIRGDAKG